MVFSTFSQSRSLQVSGLLDELELVLRLFMDKDREETRTKSVTKGLKKKLASYENVAKEVGKNRQGIKIKFGLVLKKKHQHSILVRN
jgi:hypothetical protein